MMLSVQQTGLSERDVAISRVFSAQFSQSIPPRRHDRDDLFQEAALVCLQLSPEKSFAWAKNAVRFRLINVYHHAQRRPTSALWRRAARYIGGPDGEVRVEDPPRDWETPPIPLRHWLSAVPTKHRQVIWLWADGCSLADISIRIGVSKTRCAVIRDEVICYLQWRAYQAGFLRKRPTRPPTAWGQVGHRRTA